MLFEKLEEKVDLTYKTKLAFAGIRPGKPLF